MKRKIVLLTTVLVFAMLLAITGCGGNTKVNTNTDTTKTAIDTAAAETPQEKPNAKLENIRIAWMDSATYGKDDFAKVIEDKFNVKLEFVNLSWSDYVDKLNVMVGSGDVPDMFIYPAVDDPSTKPVYFQWIKQGVLKALPDDLSKYPTLQPIMKEYEGIMKVDGKFYQIPRLAYTPQNKHFSQGILIRKDFMNKVGVQTPPATLDELYNLLVAFRDNDPDGNNKKDTVPITIGTNYAGFFEGIFGVPIGWLQEDGKYIPSVLSKNYLECIKYLNKLYKEKLLDPDFATQADDQKKDRFVNGKVGALTTNIEAQAIKLTVTDKMSKLYPDADKMLVIPTIAKGPLGDVVMTNQYNHWSGTLFNGKMDDGKMDRCLQMFDYMLSEEGLTFLRWGVEGVDFKKEGDQFVSLLPNDPNTGLPQALYVVKPTASIKNFFTWDVDGTWQSSALSRTLVDLEKEHVRIYQPLTQQGVASRLPFVSDPDLDNFKYMDLVQAFFTKAILGQYSDIDAEFAKLKNEIMTKRGGDKAVAAANRIAPSLE